MVFERFLQWTEAAPAQARADAAGALIAAYGHCGLDRQRKDRLDRMVATLLEDPSLIVRRALAEAAARSADVPRCIVVALAGDDALVAAPVLGGSALLSAADLVEAVATGDAEAQMAVANRADLPGAVAAVLVDAGQRDVALALVRNVQAAVPVATLRDILRRYGADAEIREALLEHVHRDPVLHHELVLAGAEALTRFAIACEWMSPGRAESLRRDTHDRSVVTIATRCRGASGDAGPRALVEHLRDHGRLTPALLLRALLSGNRDLCEAALSQLSGVATGRTAGLMRSPGSLGFASLYGRAGLPPGLLPVFRAALAVLRSREDEGAGLSRAAIGTVLDACGRAGGAELDRVTALLRRLEAEALRDDARLPAHDEAEPGRHPAALDLAAVRATLAAPRRALRAA